MPNTYASPIVVKYGGNAMTGEGPDAVIGEVAELYRSATPLVLVHGGGPEIDRWLAVRGVRTERIDGLRVTDEETLEVTEAVLCATINKRIVRLLGALGIRAAGISGEDGALLRAHRIRGSSGEDLGYVGGGTTCDPSLLEALLDAGFLPVVAPLATSTNEIHALNVNADLAAAAIAGAMRARAFVLLTNVRRVLADPNDPASAIDHMTLEEARAFTVSDACAGGMRPKMQAAIEAVERGATRSYICSAGSGSIGAAMQGEATIIE